MGKIQKWTFDKSGISCDARIVKYPGHARFFLNVRIELFSTDSGPSDPGLFDARGRIVGPCPDEDGDRFAASWCRGPDPDDSDPSVVPVPGNGIFGGW